MVGHHQEASARDGADRRYPPADRKAGGRFAAPSGQIRPYASSAEGAAPMRPRAMSRAVNHGARFDSVPDEKWPARMRLLFAVGTSLALWALIIFVIHLLFD